MDECTRVDGLLEDRPGGVLAGSRLRTERTREGTGYDRIVRLAVLVMLAACGRLGFPEVVTDAAAPRDDMPGDAPLDAAHPTGSISFVQVRSNGVNGGTSISTTLPAVQAGDLLLAAIDFTPLTVVPTSISDDHNNTYTLLGPFDGPGNPPNRQYLAYALSATTGDVTCTVTLSGVNTYFELRLHEYAGVSTTAPVDVVVGNGGVTSGTDGAQVSITTTGPDELIFVLAIFEQTGVAGTDYTLRDGFMNDVSEDRQAPLPMTYLASATMTSGGGWTVSALALRPQ